MAEVPRLNGVIRALESGQQVFATFAPGTAESATALAGSAYDSVVFEMEHGAFDVRGLREALQFLLDRRQIVQRSSLAPAITPFVRIPPNGREMSQWAAKQVLDSGVYGILWPHVNTVDEARNAVSACRYARPKGAPRYDPPGQRGDAPGNAARYWGLTQQEYYAKADVWPLDPDGEIVVAIMIEEAEAIENLSRILTEVPGIGLVVIGEGDLSQDLGHPRDYEHPTVVAAMERTLDICRQHDIPCGHPHVDANNVERLIEKGYRWLMPSPTRSYAALEMGRKLAGRV